MLDHELLVIRLVGHAHRDQRGLFVWWRKFGADVITVTGGTGGTATTLGGIGRSGDAGAANDRTGTIDTGAGDDTLTRRPECALLTCKCR